AYGNVGSYNGNITAPWGTISGQSVSTTGSISAGTTLSVGSSITATGSITSSTGTMTGRSLAITGANGIPHTPTTQGCYIGQASSGCTAIELVSGVGTTYQTYIYIFFRA
ncbi:MAG: hypothetical protein ACKPKO_17575, partial [Candidatus Fonsibacter sp.]